MLDIIVSSNYFLGKESNEFNLAKGTYIGEWTLVLSVVSSIK